MISVGLLCHDTEREDDNMPICIEHFCSNFYIKTFTPTYLFCGKEGPHTCQGTGVEVRGQSAGFGCLLLCGFWGLNSCPQAW